MSREDDNDEQALYEMKTPASSLPLFLFWLKWETKQQQQQGYFSVLFNRHSLSFVAPKVSIGANWTVFWQILINKKKAASKFHGENLIA